ncbi:MAG: hypothetical protein KF708_00475 [Pirellulales bacterium]|nr:hypothetical protein [Pirellulales bacterium]
MFVLLALLATPSLYLAQADEDEATPSQTSATSLGAPYRVELPGGAIVELVGIGFHPSQGKEWWGADGTPVAAPYHDFKGRVREDSITREIAVRRVKQPTGDGTFFWQPNGPGSTAGGTPLDAAGKAIHDLDAVARAFPPDSKTFSILFHVATAPWNTVETTDGRAPMSTAFLDAKLNRTVSLAFTPASERQGQLMLSVAHDLLEQDIRLVAVTNDGRELSSVRTSNVGVNRFCQTTGYFRDLELDDVKEFKLQYRPFQLFELRNLPLEPGMKTEPEFNEIESDE